MSNIVFETKVIHFAPLTIVRLPREVSNVFPSRGMVMVEGTADGQHILLPAEPDGRGGHWLDLSNVFSGKPELKAEYIIRFDIRVSEEWPEPQMPEEMMNAIAEAGLSDFWQGLTVKAKWEWFRWIRATRNPSTREKRIGVALSKMRQGDKRPCCFNSASSTEPLVSKGGVLDLPPNDI